MKRNKKWYCIDCKIDTRDEHYFVNLDLWMKAVGSKHGMVCILCLEKRIGRKLNSKDFTDCYINNPRKNTMSERLVNRITSK